MTRETKIGLLVGLAFIIVIGILLSDHLSSTNEPLGAQLSIAGENLRSGLGQGTDDVAPVLRAPQTITPSQPVVINQELKHQSTQPPLRFVEPPAIVTNTPVGTVNERLRQAAQQQGEDLVPADPNAQNNITPPAPVEPAPIVKPQAVKTTARTYQVQPGDSLGAIAHKVYGSGSRANCEAIVAANPSLADNRDLVVAGRTYTIPPLDGTPSTPTDDAPAAPVTKASTYIVKQHDTLYSIAMLEVGSPSAISAIKELNKDVLNGSDRLRPNMKLKLPGKTQND